MQASYKNKLMNESSKDLSKNDNAGQTRLSSDCHC